MSRNKFSKKVQGLNNLRLAVQLMTVVYLKKGILPVAPRKSHFQEEYNENNEKQRIPTML